jgi:hypothetical protein
MNIPVIPCAYRLLRLGSFAIFFILASPGARARLTLIKLGSQNES